jgi:hypothetical protein
VSILSTLVVLVIMGAMGAVVASSMSLGGDSNHSQVKSLMGEINAPANSPSMPSAARQAACRANVEVVEAAIGTKHATDGAYPSSIDELVNGHWLDSAPTSAGYQMTIEVLDGQATGRLLVNGQPAAQGCASAGTGR